MKPTIIAINGFGRIGRAALKIALEKPELKVAAINDLADAKTLAHLLSYDTIYGQYKKKIDFDEKNLIIDEQKIPVFNEKEPADLPWNKLGIEVVLECSGHFTDSESVGQHLEAGAKKVIISAPSKGKNPAPAHIIGVNQNEIKEDVCVINNASCTTNCIAPIMAILEAEFGIEKSMMTTVHAYTADQNLQDGPHKDLRRARAAAENIVPTTTGAAISTIEVIPSLKEKFDGLAIRVPVAIGSISDITAVLKKETTKESINQIFKDKADKGIYKGILAVTEDQIVSSDIIGSTYSSIIDLSLTNVVGGNLVKIVAWYDNEWGYANRLVEMISIFSSPNSR